jgi:hypothetical protein
MFLTFDHGTVSLGKEPLPGILLNLSVDGCVSYDQAEEDGLSGKTKTPLGWDDADVSITMELLSDSTTDTCYNKLRIINRVFKGYDRQSNPQVFTVVNAHLAARDVDQVVFEQLVSREDDKMDTIIVALKFKEHTPPIQNVEQRAIGSAPGTTAKEPGLVIPTENSR